MIGFRADRKTQTMVADDIPAMVTAAQNDPAAFGRLYDRYVQPIYRYIYSRVGSPHEAEDITSQTFVAAYEALGRYRERGQFSAWLFRIARSKMNDHFRRSRREVELEAAGELLDREDALGVLIRAEEMSFTFDAGANPQHDQTWELNNEFEIAGYRVRVTSARAVIWEDVQEPSYIDGSQGYDYGYQFTVEADPSVKMTVEMDIMSESPMCGFAVGVPFIPSGPSLQYAQLCRDEYPKGPVKVTIWELAVLLENTWQSTWTP